MSKASDDPLPTLKEWNLGNAETGDRKSTGTMKVDGKEMTWDQIVSKYGETQATELAPNLDPRYQALLSKEGSGKAASDYSKQVLDPETETTGIAPDMEGGIHRLKSSSVPDARGLGDVLGFVDNPAGPTAGAVGLEPDNNTSAAKGKGKGNQTVTVNPTPVTDAGTQLLNGLISSYQSINADVAPYISGQAGQAATQTATQIAQQLAGGGVQAPVANTKLNQDYANIGKADTAGQKGVVQALNDTGTALNDYLTVAPYQGLLNALQSESQYQLETGTGSINPTTLKSSPAWLQNAYNYALSNSNTQTGTSTVGSSGSTAATSPSTNSGGGSVPGGSG